MAHHEEISYDHTKLPQVSYSSSNAIRRLILSSPIHSFPLVFSGTSDIPPATAVNYVGWATVGFVFQYLSASLSVLPPSPAPLCFPRTQLTSLAVRRRWFGFWTKYNCTSGSFSGFFPSRLSSLPSRCTIRGPRCWHGIGDYCRLLLVRSFPRNSPPLQTDAAPRHVAYSTLRTGPSAPAHSRIGGATRSTRTRWTGRRHHYADSTRGSHSGAWGRARARIELGRC